MNGCICSQPAKHHTQFHAHSHSGHKYTPESCTLLHPRSSISHFPPQPSWFPVETRGHCCWAAGFSARERSREREEDLVRDRFKPLRRLYCLWLYSHHISIQPGRQHWTYISWKVVKMAFIIKEWVLLIFNLNMFTDSITILRLRELACFLWMWNKDLTATL